MADEGEEVAVGREGEGAGGAAVEDELMRGGGVGEIRRSRSGRRGRREGVWPSGVKSGCVTIADEDGLGAGGEGLDEDLDGCGALEVGGVGGLAVGSGFGAIGVGDGGGVGRPG